MSLKLFQRNGVWYFRGTVAGRRFYQPAKTTDRKVAERIKAETEAQAWQRRFDGPGAGLTMAQVFTAYLDADKSERSFSSWQSTGRIRWRKM